MAMTAMKRVLDERLEREDGYNDCFDAYRYGEDVEDVKKNCIGRSAAYRKGWVEALSVIHR